MIDHSELESVKCSDQETHIVNIKQNKGGGGSRRVCEEER